MIPDAYEREKIEELCSFIFGRQLLPIAYTLFDHNENAVEAYAYDPWGKTAKSFCSRPDYPPINIDPFLDRKADVTIGQLMPKYFELCEPLCLKEALWNLWISRTMPVGTNLPVLAAAVESIINSWFKSKNQGVYMKTEEFIALLKDELEGIEMKLSEKPNNKKIISNILRANSFGIMERYRIFFEEIGLQIGAHEWAAINERHKFVHGFTRFDNTDWGQVLQHVNTFETLLSKIMLKLLEYKGTFVDRSVIGWKDTLLI